MGSSSATAAALTVALLLALSGASDGQSDCVNQLVPCYADLNTTTPSNSCCTAIRQVVTTQLACLCNLVNNPSALGPINMTQALMLPSHCGLSNDTSPCKGATSPTGSTSRRPPGSAGGVGSGASLRSWMGMPILLLVSGLAFLY